MVGRYVVVLLVCRCSGLQGRLPLGATFLPAAASATAAFSPRPLRRAVPGPVRGMGLQDGVAISCYNRLFSSYRLLQFYSSTHSSNLQEQLCTFCIHLCARWFHIYTTRFGNKNGRIPRPEIAIIY